MADTYAELQNNYFIELNNLNVSDKIELKDKLSYLPWTDAWAEIKKLYPDANRTIYENNQGWCYHTDGKTCWVKVGVTVNEIEHIEYFAVMDYRNKSIPFENVTSVDVNKSIQRATVKAIARHGLGLYIYRGEDLPESDVEEQKKAREELDAAIKKVVEAGTKLIKAGVDKSKVSAIVAEISGNGNPNAIQTVEVAEAVLSKIESARKALMAKKKEETK